MVDRTALPDSMDVLEDIDMADAERRGAWPYDETVDCLPEGILGVDAIAAEVGCGRYTVIRRRRSLC